MKSLAWTLFIYGLIAGSLAIGISLLFRTSFNTIFLPELGSQTIFALTPGEIESQALESLGSLAKYMTFFASLVINFLIYGILGIIVFKILEKNKTKNYFLDSIKYSIFSYLIFIGIALILILLLQLRTGGSNFHLFPIVISFLPPNFAFGFIFSIILKGKNDNQIQSKHKTLENKTNHIDSDRRAFLRLAAFSIISIPLFALGLNRLFVGQPSETTLSEISITNSTNLPPPIGFEHPLLERLMSSEITPTSLFYRIDINPVIPVIDASTWHLDIKGMVDNSFSINYDELKNMNSIQQYATLQCVSNQVGGDLISTALWRGIPLKDILIKAKVKPNVKYIFFRCYDGYDVGIPLDRGLMEGTILAFEMNKLPLTNSHGFPVRAIVPGLYGMMNPKWITEIELVEQVYEGYWQRNGWSNVAEIMTTSTILIPGQAPLKHRFRNIDQIPRSKTTPIAGIAFGGDRGISKIEVSIDGGQTWKTANIKEPLSKYTWVLWTAGYAPNDDKNYKIIVRATDKTGQLQTSEIRKPFPDGATGYHYIET